MTKSAMTRGFVSHELLVTIAVLAVVIGFCLPILASMRSGRFPPAMGVTLVGAVGVLVLGFWLYSGWSGRRRMKEIEVKRTEPKDA